MIGHKFQGTHVEVKNSPVNIHIHIHGENEDFVNKILRVLNNVIGRRTESIEESKKLSEEFLQGRVNRIIEDGRHDKSSRKIDY